MVVSHASRNVCSPPVSWAMEHMRLLVVMCCTQIVEGGGDEDTLRQVFSKESEVEDGGRLRVNEELEEASPSHVTLHVCE